MLAAASCFAASGLVLAAEKAERRDLTTAHRGAVETPVTIDAVDAEKCIEWVAGEERARPEAGRILVPKGGRCEVVVFVTGCVYKAEDVW